MPVLEILTLGSPEVRLDGRRVAVKPMKALALLIYLATSGCVHSRDSLATMLWPDSGQRQARAALRRRLSELSACIGDEWLSTDGDQISLDPGPDVWIDRVYFEQALAECRTHGHGANEVCPACLQPLNSAAELYRSDFLAGFSLADCPEFDDWQFFQAESSRQQLAFVLERLVQLHCSQGNPAAAIPHARRWAALDPLHEPAHRTLMQVYEESGQRAAALRQYELCVQTLDSELGVAPDTETTALYETIRAAKTSTPSAIRPAEPATPDRQALSVQPEPPQDEVRMATALALDVDATTEEDWDRRPDEIAARVAELLHDAPGLLSRYEAHIAHIHDSGFLALFGLPTLHEDDAERALHAALALQEAAGKSELAITAGISTGMVYVCQSSRNGEPAVTGSTAKLALRLKGQASRGSVIADAATYRQSQQAFRFAPHELHLLGHDEPVTVYEVLRPRRHSVKSRGIGSLHAPLVGRDAELAQLTEALDKARQGQGQLVTVVGEAGLGKSRLVAELEAAALDVAGESDAGMLWLEGRCLEMNRSVAYGPFVDIVQSFFGWMPHAPEAERARLICATLDELVQEQRLTTEQIDVMGPILGQLLSLHYGNDWDTRLENARPEQIRFLTFQTLSDLFTALARRRPLVLVLEDLHWADDLSLDLAGHLMEKLEDTPLLLLCVYRPEAALAQDKLTPLATRKCPAALTEIRLRELTPGNSRALVEALLHVEGLTPDARSRILDTCRGNPFFLEEVIHDLIEAGLVYQDGEVWRAREEISATTVPNRVQSVILARVDRLEPAQRQALQYAAVIGRLFSPQVLAATMPPDAAVDEALATLEERAFIYPEQTVPAVVYSFRHVLAQDAVYATIPGQRRAALHGRVGDSLEQVYGNELDEVVDRLAFHYDRSDANEKAIKYLLVAGDKAARAYATDEAVAYYRRALQRLDEMEQDQATVGWRFHALSELGKTLMRSSRYDDAETSLRQAIVWGREHKLPPKQVARLYWWLGDLLMNWKPRYEQTLQAGLEGMALLGEEDAESVEAAMLCSIIAFGYQYTGDDARFQETTSHLAGFLNRLPFTEEFRVCYGCIIDASGLRNDRDEVLWWLEIAEQKARRYHDDWSLAEFMLTQGRVRFFTGVDPDETLDSVRTSLSLFARVGDAKRVNWSEISLGEVLGDYGQSSQAEIQLRAALKSAYNFNQENVTDVLLKLASCCLAQRKWAAAKEALREALHSMEKRQENTAEALTLLGFHDLANGDCHLAAERFSRALHSLDNPDNLFYRSRKWCLLVNSLFANALYGLERALDDAAAFRSFCNEFRAQHPSAQQANFRRWRLEPAEPTRFSTIPVSSEQFESPLQVDWIWCDPDGGCSYEVDQGLTVWSPVARDLLFPFLNAPRVMRPIEGNFMAQVTCESACTDRPGIGGILLWQDEHNYLRLCIGVRAQDEMSLEGCIANQDVIIGRGRLVASPVTLRIERTGNMVSALCSADGEAWYRVGQVVFPASGPLQVGLVAIGFPDRTIYHAPYPDGTAIRFTDFRLWN